MRISSWIAVALVALASPAAAQHDVHKKDDLPYAVRVAEGHYEGLTYTHKFGRNGDVHDQFTIFFVEDN